MKCVLRVTLIPRKGSRKVIVCFYQPNNLLFAPRDHLGGKVKVRKKVKRASFKFIACKIFQYGFYVVGCALTDTFVVAKLCTTQRNFKNVNI